MYVKVRGVIHSWSVFTEAVVILSSSCFCVYVMKNPVLGLFMNIVGGRRAVEDTLQLQRVKVGEPSSRVCACAVRFRFLSRGVGPGLPPKFHKYLFT